ncbi:M24 family metallopeptidase [Candidatus Dependentiae bacterium]|nr:M24 family metallopeptidase [Candidatus Dependentiae bacterium]
MAFVPRLDYSLFKNRRKQVINFLKQEYPDLKKGLVILFADFETQRHLFRQESSFYYLTGITEPGAIFCMYFDGRQELYLPNYGGVRERWTTTFLSDQEPKESLATKIGVTKIKQLGKSCNSYFFSPVFTRDKYANFLNDLHLFLQNSIDTNIEVFTLLDGMGARYFSQINIYKNLLDLFAQLENITNDLAPLVHYLRRFKSEYEIDLIYKAVQITSLAHQAASKIIMPGRIEHEVQAVVESVFTQIGANGPAFPSIIASGKNTTVLHYTKKDKELLSNELLVVDVGAQYAYYAADLTRTYPVNGRFNKRQLEVYNIVLQTQVYIETIAKPGMYLNNSQYPDKSLQHLALTFLEKMGYAKYFTHGIGHFLGLDVHDVGDNIYPLSAGDIFTIEPGIYIPQENLGVRIEDNYLMTDDGVVCLSYQLPRKAEEVEQLMIEELE